MIKEYLLQNWSLILILSALAVALHITVFMDKRTIRRMYVLVVGVFLLSLAVFFEFNYASFGDHAMLRSILMCIRYSATPFIISQLIYTLVKNRLGKYLFPLSFSR